MTEDKLAHLGDDPLPEGLYEPDEAAIVRYAQKSTRAETIDDATYAALRDHFDEKQIIEVPVKKHKFTVFEELLDIRPVGFFTWETEGAVRNIRYRELGADE